MDQASITSCCVLKKNWPSLRFSEIPLYNAEANFIVFALPVVIAYVSCFTAVVHSLQGGVSGEVCTESYLYSFGYCMIVSVLMQSSESADCRGPLLAADIFWQERGDKFLSKLTIAFAVLFMALSVLLSALTL